MKLESGSFGGLDGSNNIFKNRNGMNQPFGVFFAPIISDFMLGNTGNKGYEIGLVVKEGEGIEKV